MSNIEDLIRNNSHIYLPKSSTSSNINNMPGRYWLAMTELVFALTDLRARLGTFNDPWSSEKNPLFAPPPFEIIPDRLSDLIDQRAIELNSLAKSQGRRILIMWSGGIDSTVVLAAFIKNLPPADLANISVLLTLNSISENPEFYQTQIAGKIHCMPYLDYVVSEENIKKYMVLHGDPADCLFGPSVAMYSDLIPEGNHLKPFKDNVSLIANSIEKKSLRTIKRLRVEGFGRWYAKKVTDNLLEVAPPGVETISDWWWWHYYNLKWEFSILRYVLRRKTDGFETQPLSPHAIESIVKDTFFNTDKFQQWSYSNLRNHIGKDLSTHKLQAKQYIYELDRNQMYFDYKTKMESIPAYDQGSIVQIRRPFLWGRDMAGHYPDNQELRLKCINLLESYKG